MSQNFIFAQDVILDPDTGKIVAVVRNGGVWRDGSRIAVLLGAHMYDLKGMRAEPSGSRRCVPSTMPPRGVAIERSLSNAVALMPIYPHLCRLHISCNNLKEQPLGAER
jgi:hypothetical protein